jgi:hypothetical protein
LAWFNGFPYGLPIVLKARQKEDGGGRFVCDAGRALDDSPDRFPVMDEEDAGKDKLLRIVHAVCEWLYPPNCDNRTLILRVHAFIWYIKPEWLGGCTQVELAARLNVSKQNMGKVINNFRKKFGFYVAGMRSTEARRKFAARAHQRAGELAAARRRASAKAKGQG